MGRAGMPCRRGCALLLMAAWLAVTLAAVPPEPPAVDWSGTRSDIVAKSSSRSLSANLRSGADSSFLETAEGALGSGDDHYCIREANMPPLTYCPQVDYATAVRKADLKRLPGTWRAAPNGSTGLYYFWDASGATQWTRPDTATFALLERRAEALVQKVTNSGKVGCERTVRAAVCALVFPRCDHAPRAEDNWSDEDTGRTGADQSVHPIGKLYRVCDSFCEAAAECLAQDFVSGADSLGPVEGQLARTMGLCGRHPVWAGEDCCCSHAWGLAQSHGGNKDGLQVASFAADAMAVYYHLRPYVGEKKFILAVREPRVIDLFLGGKIGALPLAHSDIDYSLDAVDPEGFERVLGTLDEGRPYVSGPQTMTEFCPAMMAKESGCPAVLEAAGTQLLPRPECKYIMGSMIVVNKAPSAATDEGKYCRGRAEGQARFLNGMCDGRPPRLTDTICAMSKYASARRTLPAVFDKWYPHGAPPKSTLVPARCSGREIVSGPEDTVFLYISSHGGSSGSLSIGERSVIGRDQIRAAIKNLADRRRFKKMLIVVDACYSASIFEGWDEMPPRVYVVTSAITDFVAFMQNTGNEVEESFLSNLAHAQEVWDMTSLFTKAWLGDAMNRLVSASGADATVEAQCEFVRESLVGTISGDVNLAAGSAELPRCIGVSSDRGHFTTPLKDFFRRTYDTVPVGTPDGEYAAGISTAHQSFTDLHNIAVDRRNNDIEAMAKAEARARMERYKRISETPVPWPPRTVAALVGNELDVGVLLAARVLMQSTKDCDFLTEGLGSRLPHLEFGEMWDPENDYDDRYLMALRAVFDAGKASVVSDLEELAASKAGLKRGEILAAVNKIVPPFGDEPNTVDDRVMLEYLLFYMMRAHTDDARVPLARLDFARGCMPARTDPNTRQLMTVIAAVFRRLAAICSAEQTPEAARASVSREDVMLVSKISTAQLDDFATRAATERGETGGVYGGLRGDVMMELQESYVESLCADNCQKDSPMFRGRCAALLPFNRLPRESG